MPMEFDNEYTITYNRETFKTTPQKTKKCCKVLKFLSECSLEEVLISIAGLSSDDFPALYFFIIEATYFGFFEKESKIMLQKCSALEKFLLKFSENRPFIMQLESKNENIIKIFCKDENSSEFFELNQQINDSEKYQQFFSFYSLCMNGELQTVNDNLINKLIKKEYSSLNLRLLRTLKILDNSFMKKIIFKCAAIGSPNQLLASMDVAFDFNNHGLHEDAIKFLSETFFLNSEKDEFHQSILLTAVENKNKEVVLFLLKHFKSYILKLPFLHQTYISKIAFDTDQIEILCNLLECDFPFPKDFNFSFICDERLKKITNERIQFHQWIEEKKIPEIKDFIVNNPNLKNIFNIHNDAALTHARNCKNYEVYYFLKSYGLKEEQNLSFNEVAENEKDLENVQRAGVHQRRRNVFNALPNEDSAVMILIARSLIHNQILTDPKKLKHRCSIEKWFKEINKTEFGPAILHVASQCDELKIIFDFGNETVHSIDLNATNSLGVTYSSLKRIFVGAEGSCFKNREQKIKGVLVHEICHYALRLVFENKENPYYEFDEEKAIEFDKVVETYKKFGESQSKLDDECDGILSNVYNSYGEHLYHIELVVVAPQIQVEYDQNEEKRNALESKFELLFQFMRNYVMPEMKEFNLQHRDDVRYFNNRSKIFCEIVNLSPNIKILEHAFDFNNNKIFIVNTNVKKLLLLNVYVFLQKKYRNLIDAKNIFTSSNFLAKSSDFNYLLSKAKLSYVVIDCTENYGNILKFLKNNRSSTFVFILKCETQCKQLKKELEFEGLSPIELVKKFTWNDMSNESKKFLIQKKVLFQGCKTLSLNDLIPNLIETNEQSIFDDDVLNLLVEDEEIILNSKITDELSNKNFKFLFQPRKFVKVEKKSNDVPESNKINQTLTYDQLLNSVKNDKFVIISDIAGTGKSWQLKKMEEILCNFYPHKWISYIDLKQCIRAFKLSENLQNFSLFMIENILKLENKFESNVFKIMYENGNVILLFDGFDEIAPDYVVFVFKLIKSFTYNNGNQLWIATRDYFEKDLIENLKIKTVYKLDKFVNEENILMLVASWILYDLEKNKVSLPESNFLEFIKSSQDFENYQKIAQKLSAEILCTEVQSIGSPLFYKMTADIFKDDKNKYNKVTVPEVYKKFIKIQILRWSKEGGEIRENDSVEQNINKTLNYREIHQLFALISLFPNCSEFCDLDINDCDWNDEQIIACGIINKKDGVYYFPHETFREYYAADFIVRVISGKKPDIENLFKYLLTFLTTKKYGIVRMFLNEAISEDAIARKICQYLLKISKCFYANIDMLINLSYVFEEKFEFLGKFLIDLFKLGTYKDIQAIFENNQLMINLILDNTEMFEYFEDFILNSLDVNDLKKFIIDFKIYQKLASSTINEMNSNRFIQNIKEKTNLCFSNAAFKIQNEFEENVLFCLVQSNYNGILKMKLFFETLQNSMNINDFVELLKQTNRKGWNIFHTIINSYDNEKLDFLFQNIKNFLTNNNLLHVFKNLCNQKSYDQENILHISAKCLNTNFHESFWNHLILKEIFSLEELTQLILQKDHKSINFVHCMVMSSQSNVIELVFEILKNKLKEEQFMQILLSKGAQSMNLLHVAARSSKDIKTHKYLWKIIKDSCNQEIWKILEESDEEDNNILNIAAGFVNKEIFEFIIDELEKIGSKDEIKKLFCNLDIYLQNIFHHALRNKSLELCEALWYIVQKHFDSDEIFELIVHLNTYGTSIVSTAKAKNTEVVTAFLWKQISNFMRENFSLTEEENVKLNLCDGLLRNYSKSKNITANEKELLNFTWLKNRKKSKLFEKYYQLNENISIKTLMSFINNQNLESHKILWQHLLNVFKDRSQLLELLSRKDKFGYSFIINLIYTQKIEIIDFTLKSLKQISNETQYSEIVRSKAYYNRYLFQRQYFLSKNLEIYRYFWDIFKNTLTQEEFINILQKGDDTNKNILNLACSFGSNEILEFIMKEIENLIEPSKIKNMLSQLTIFNQNILQVAAKRNRSLDVHKFLWKIMYKYFVPAEILQFITHTDTEADNSLLMAIKLNFKDIINLTWEETLKILQNNNFGQDEQYTKNLKKCDTIIKNILQFDDIKEYEKEMFKLKWIDKSNSCLFEFALVDEQKLAIKSIYDLMTFISDKSEKNHEILWKYLIKNFNNPVELKNLLANKNAEGEIYIHLLVVYNESNIIEQTLKTIKKIFSEFQFNEILKLRGYQKRNLLQRAIISKKIKTVELLWNTFFSIFKLNEFIEILLETDEDGNNIINFAACYTTVDVFNFLNKELENENYKNEILDIIFNLNFAKQNLLQSACVFNRHIEIHKIIWRLIHKHLKALEKVEFINNCDKNGLNLLSSAIFHCNIDIVKLTWSNIKNIINQRTNQIQYLKCKDNNNKTIYDLALENKVKDSNVVDFVRTTLQEYELNFYNY